MLPFFKWKLNSTFPDTTISKCAHCVRSSSIKIRGYNWFTPWIFYSHELPKKHKYRQICHLKFVIPTSLRSIEKSWTLFRTSSLKTTDSTGHWSLLFAKWQLPNFMTYEEEICLIHRSWSKNLTFVFFFLFFPFACLVG